MSRAQNVRMTGLIKRARNFVITELCARRSDTSGGFFFAWGEVRGAAYRQRAKSLEMPKEIPVPGKENPCSPQN
jgi:hypothetical protein